MYNSIGEAIKDFPEFADKIKNAVMPVKELHDNNKAPQMGI